MLKSVHRAELRNGLASLAVVAAVPAAIGVALNLPGQDRVDARSQPATTWVSGEQRGRVVLTAVDATEASVAVRLGEETSQYSIVDLGEKVLVHDASGERIVVLDGASGLVLEDEKIEAPAEAEQTARPRLFRAGAVAYFISPESNEIWRIDGDAQVMKDTFEGDVTDWVGTSDGTAWLYDKGRGAYSTFDGEWDFWVEVNEGDRDVLLSAVGEDAVLLNRTAAGLRWLRSGQTLFDPTLRDVDVLQEPSLAGSCVAVVTAGSARCLTPDGASASLELAAPVDDSFQVFSNGGALVAVAPGRSDVVVASWPRQASSVVARSEPSGRPAVSWSAAGELLVDDPGSRYAFTSDGADITVLDKFSRQTVVVDSEGAPLEQAEEGPSDSDGAQGVVLPQDDAPEVVDTNDRNDPPEPQPDRAVTRSGRDVTIDALANDADPDGDVLAIVEAGPARTGQVTVLAARAVVYAPPDDFEGVVDFPYTVTDPGNLRGTSAITVEVVDKDRNTQPVAVADVETTREGVPVAIPVLLNDTDAEGDPLNIISVSQPIHGTATVTGDGQVRYQPASGYYGGEAFTYTISDGYGGTATGDIEVTIEQDTSQNRPPEPRDDRSRTVAGQRVSIPVLANDTDPDGDVLRVIDVGEASGATAAVVGGQFVDVLPSVATSGAITFTYTVEDVRGLRSSAQILLLVDPASGNRPPNAVDDVLTNAGVPKVYDLVANDVDPDGDPLVITDVSQPMTGGTVTKVSAGSIRFAPSPAATGRLEFTYRVSDPAGQTAEASVTIELVRLSNAGPVAENDVVTVFPGEEALIPILANDYHPDGLPFSLAGPPVVRAGSAQVRPDGSISYRPPLELGTYTLTYTIRDTAETPRTDSAEVVVTVIERPKVNRPPSPSDDRVATRFETAATIDVLANDTDPDRDELRIQAVGSPNVGSASVQSGRIRYTPPSGFSGLATFTYVVTDAGGLRANATVVVDVADREKIPPTTQNDLLRILVGKDQVIDPRVNDADPDGTPAALVISSVVAQQGSARVVESGVLVSAPSRPAEYDVTYTVTDPDGKSATGTIRVVAELPPNAEPVAKDDTATTPYQTAVTINVLANDTDPDGGTLTIASASGTAGNATGTVAVNASRSAIVFTPAKGFAGTTTFTYKVVDDKGASATGTVTVVVNACTAVPPQVADDKVATAAGTPVFISLFVNDGSTVGVLEVGPPTIGKVEVIDAASGQVKFTPPSKNYTGIATFSYRLTSECGAISTATVTVTINRAPVAVDDTATVVLGSAADIRVLANDSDPDGDALTLTAVSSATNGTAAINGQLVRFTPTALGIGSFTYTIRDDTGLSASAQVTVTITEPPNTPPTIRDESASVDAGREITVDVLANDSDPDGDRLTLANASLVSGPGGNVSFSSANGTVTYQAPGVGGTARISYTVTDRRGAVGIGTLTITIIPPPTPPPTTPPPTTAPPTTAPPTTPPPPTPTVSP